MEKRIFLIVILTTITLGVFAQSMKVKDFHLLERDLTANTEGTKRISPQDGNVSALIKVVTTEKDFNFDGGNYSIVGDIEYHPGEIWVYVPARAQKLSISHNRFGIVRDYYYPVPIEAGRTYEMMLDPGVGKYITIQTQTPRATVYIDGDSIGTSPIYAYYALYGKHNLHAINDRMEGNLQIEILNDGNENVENFTIPMVDQSAHFGRVKIQTESDVEIFLDGALKGHGSWEGDLREGNYVVETRKTNCDPAKTYFEIQPRKAITINAHTPTPHMGYLQLFTRPRDTYISVNGEHENDPSHIALPVGLHTLTFLRKGYHRQEKEYDIRHNVTISDTINLARIQYLKRNGFYFGAAYTISELSGVSGFVGMLYSGFDLQLGYTFGITKSNPVNFYDQEGGFKSKSQFSQNILSIKLGYQIPIASRFGLVPQIGYTANTLKCNLLEGTEKTGDGSVCNCVSLGCKFIFTPAQHLYLFVSPEYDMAASKSKTFENITNVAGFSCGGFNCNAGVMINF